MNIIIQTGFEKVSHNIQFQPQSAKKGKQLVDANHVKNVQEHRQNGLSLFIKSDVIRQTAVTSPPYNTKVFLDVQRKVTSAICTCVYGKSGKCKHISALICFVNNEESVSKTNFEQQWGKPTTRQLTLEKYSKGKYFFEMFPPPKKEVVKAQGCDLSELKKPSALRTIMIEASVTQDERSIRTILNEMLDQVDNNIQFESCNKCLNTIFSQREIKKIYCSNYKVTEELFEFYKESVVLNREQIIKLCCDTLTQANCDKWHEARRLRISSSSNAHSIKSRKTKSIDAVIGDILHPKKIETPSTRYGTRNESKARSEYEQLYGVKVEKVGVIVCDAQPWLCASLDGVVFEGDRISRIVEFKCPFSCKDLPIVNLEKKILNVKYLEFKNDQVTLRQSAVYYTQCQLQLYLSGCDICDLFIWSSVKNGSLCVPISRNESFLNTVILQCEHFYFTHFLPALCATLKNESEEKEKQRVKKEVLKDRCFGCDITNC